MWSPNQPKKNGLNYGSKNIQKQSRSTIARPSKQVGKGMITFDHLMFRAKNEYPSSSKSASKRYPLQINASTTLCSICLYTYIIYYICVNRYCFHVECRHDECYVMLLRQMHHKCRCVFVTWGIMTRFDPKSWNDESLLPHSYIASQLVAFPISIILPTHWKQTRIPVINLNVSIIQSCKMYMPVSHIYN